MSRVQTNIGVNLTQPSSGAARESKRRSGSSLAAQVTAPSNPLHVLLHGLALVRQVDEGLGVQRTDRLRPAEHLAAGVPEPEEHRGAVLGASGRDAGAAVRWVGV